MKKFVLIAGALALPLVSFAQLTELEGLSTSVGTIVKNLIPVAFGLAILFFFYGLATYILGKDQDKEVAKKRMLWGVIAIFVMASIWGIVTWLGDIFGVSGGTMTAPDITLPKAL